MGQGLILRIERYYLLKSRISVHRTWPPREGYRATHFLPSRCILSYPPPNSILPAPRGTVTKGTFLALTLPYRRISREICVAATPCAYATIATSLNRTIGWGQSLQIGCGIIECRSLSTHRLFSFLIRSTS